GYGRGLELETLRALNQAATRGRRPDLTLLFDLDPSSGIARRAAAGRANRIDQEPLEFHARVREGFLSIARQESGRMVVLDAALGPDEVERHVWAVLEPRLQALEHGTPGQGPRSR